MSTTSSARQMASDSVIERLTHRLFGSAIIRNDVRGELLEEIVAMALEPEWRLCSGDWAACDLVQANGFLRIQVKQSAARQSWHTEGGPSPKPNFSIASKTGRYEGATWIPEPGRNAEIYIFGWHDRTDATADHRNPSQWQFFVVPERDLPSQKSLSLSWLRTRGAPVMFEQLAESVRDVAACLAVKSSD
jgi:hypothetical protein